jgi:outer membrane murein-binding lipoprotein Lpp
MTAGGMWPSRQCGLKNVEELSMKRILLSAVMLGVSGLVIGCDSETAKTEKSTTVQTPTGTDKKTETVKETKTGDAKDGAPATKP